MAKKKVKITDKDLPGFEDYLNDPKNFNVYDEKRAQKYSDQCWGEFGMKAPKWQRVDKKLTK